MVYYWYCGCATRANKVAWCSFSVLLAASIALLVGTSVNSWSCFARFFDCGGLIFDRGYITTAAASAPPGTFQSSSTACQYLVGATAVAVQVNAMAPAVIDPGSTGALTLNRTLLPDITTNVTDAMTKQCMSCFDGIYGCLETSRGLFIAGLVMLALTMAPCVFFICCGACPMFFDGPNKPHDGEGNVGPEGAKVASDVPTATKAA